MFVFDKLRKMSLSLEFSHSHAFMYSSLHANYFPRHLQTLTHIRKKRVEWHISRGLVMKRAPASINECTYLTTSSSPCAAGRGRDSSPSQRYYRYCICCIIIKESEGGDVRGNIFFQHSLLCGFALSFLGGKFLNTNSLLDKVLDNTQHSACTC